MSNLEIEIRAAEIAAEYWADGRCGIDATQWGGLMIYGWECHDRWCMGDDLFGDISSSLALIGYLVRQIVCGDD